MKSINLLYRLIAASLAVILLTGASPFPAAWVDHATGIAIGGYDPMSYLTRGEPKLGRDEYELQWGGVTWRFLNEGNQAEFAAHPEVYAPRFMGYDPYSLSKGFDVQGLPTIWEIYKGGLYLFSSKSNYEEWKRNRKQVNAKVQKDWPKLARSFQQFRYYEPDFGIKVLR